MDLEKITQKTQEYQIKAIEVMEKELEVREAKAEADKAVQILRKAMAEKNYLPATDAEGGATKLV